MLLESKVVENLFRNEYGKIIALLVNKFGTNHIEIIEDAVQDALIKAMQVWGYKNIPDNPTAWLLRVSGNLLVDKLRRDKRVVFDDEYVTTSDTFIPNELDLKNTISDSQLRMIFACCHPSLSKEYQIILSLKLIGGFGNKEIAKALLKKEDAVAKSFTRAKKKFKETISTLDIPIEMGLQSRLKVVLKVIYLLFSEGYAASVGTSIIKKDICLEAIRLALLLTENAYCNKPETNALIALMCFHTSRFEARVDDNLELVDLEHQNRSKYNLELINQGLRHLQNADGEDVQPSNYHLEAAVSYHHCIAKSFKETNWEQILYIYNLQLQRQYSPIVELNRIIPFFKVYGANKAMNELKNYEKSAHLVENSLYYAIKAELLMDMGEVEASISALERAIKLTKNELEKNHFKKKVERLSA